jgi:acid phosphatase
MKVFQGFAVILGAAFLAGCATTREPRNLTEAKWEVECYVEGRYPEDLATVSRSAETWIRQRSARGGRLAVVFDIDETTLSNLEVMRKSDWGYDEARWHEWMVSAKAPALEPVREVYRTARSQSVAVYFITGRKAKLRAATLRNLSAQGMGDFTGLIFRPNDNRQSAKEYKTSRREEISRRGFTIIANIGDQPSDLDGGFAERTFKLPNPFYRIR